MVIHKFNSFRRYTPPTCTLEIYHPQPFWGRWRDQSFPPLFSFQLHFDDPRLAQEDRMSIIGDRDLLEKLRIKVEQYIHQYLDNLTTEAANPSCEISAKEESELMYLSRQSTYSHLLYYQSFEPHQEVIEVVLSNTQLVDFVNALEAYHLDATTVQVKPKKGPISLGTGLALTAMVTTLGGYFWWRYQSNNSIEIVEEIPQPASENNQKNISAVIPPSPLDLKTVPQIVTPKIPIELLNQPPLLPPPPALTKPPSDLLNNSNLEQNSRQLTRRNPQSSQQIKPQPSISSPEDSINSPLLKAMTSSFPAKDKPSQQWEKVNNRLISRLPSLPVIPSGDSPKNTMAMASSSPMKNLANVGTTNKSIQPNLDKNFNSSSSSIVAKNIRRNISGEVKQYFQNKWHPPENLKQSIEYRLQLQENGVLSDIIPVGQVATIFLEKTPMPLKGEVITSTFSKKSPLTVRLILTPNGDVQTFAER